MSSPDFPPVAEILPHRGQMVLLGRVLEHGPDATVCGVAIDAQKLFVQNDGSIGSWVGVEYMAQCVGAHAGMLARAVGMEPRVGYLVSSRRLRFHAARFAPGQELRTLFVTSERRGWALGDRVREGDQLLLRRTPATL